MNRLSTSLLSCVLTAATACASAGGSSAATSVSAPPRSAETLAGSWTLVSVDNVLADGTRIQPYGSDPVGMLVLTPDGRYSVQIFRRARPRFAANDKARGTAAENQETVRGTNSHFGRYELSPAGDTITFRIEHASFPNWEGTTQKRVFTLLGDELRYVVRTTTTGGSEIGEVAWRRTSR